MSCLSQIYTEKIHHVKCCRCDNAANTADDSHEIGKAEAAKAFQENGWYYLKNVGWLCPYCNGLY
jgi:hypothetical protein